MWIRILGRIGNSNAVVLPSALLRGLKWGRGDFVQISVLDQNKVLLTRFDANLVSDAVREAIINQQKTINDK